MEQKNKTLLEKIIIGIEVILTIGLLAFGLLFLLMYFI